MVRVSGSWEEGGKEEERTRYEISDGDSSVEFASLKLTEEVFTALQSPDVEVSL